ncbi:hypothetical protein [uncultured Acetobacteroides sp.]|uniref:hypothetical protein n=1 Tax=uncultured Acetobacteroides sp. TaxID=1760811 RepID=UPI002AA8926A|nr:hypothetical protein [uncultured Acetobacteroides sp.]
MEVIQQQKRQRDSKSSEKAQQATLVKRVVEGHPMLESVKHLSAVDKRRARIRTKLSGRDSSKQLEECSPIGTMLHKQRQQLFGYGHTGEPAGQLSDAIGQPDGHQKKRPTACWPVRSTDTRSCDAPANSCIHREISIKKLYCAHAYAPRK